jgi:AcrR family transcriptional regulator
MSRIADPRRRDTILEAARQTFIRDGYENAHMADIARRAKMAVGTLYLYFDSKDAMARAIAAQAFRRAAEVIVPLLERPLTPALISTLVRRTFDAVFEDETFGKFDIPMSDVFPTYAPDAYGALVARISDAFARQMELGIMRRDDPAMLADYFAILLRRAVIQSAYVGNRRREPYASTLSRFLAAGLIAAD